MTVSVTHVSPALVISGASSVAEGSAYALSLSSSDPGHAINSWSIDWGDGTTQAVAGNPSAVTHTYATGPNGYTIWATATDNVGTYAAGNIQAVLVTHVPPTLAISGPGTTVEGTAYTLGLSATDQGHAIVSWTIDWGDGTTESVMGKPASVQHTYAIGPNSHTIVATATDDVGTYSAGNTLAVLVTHVPPTLAISGPEAAVEGSAYVLNLSASDPGHTIGGWSIDWGDGTVQAVAGSPASVAHTYGAGPSSYTISAAATDDVGTYAAARSVPLVVAVNIGLAGKATLGQSASLTASADQVLYQVTVGQLANLAVALAAKKQKLDFVLLDANLNPVQELLGKKSLSLSRKVAAGTYFLRITLPGEQSTAFTLKLSAKPIAPARSSKHVAAAKARLRSSRPQTG